MNNIERKLLSVTLTNVNIDLIEEIINATPNATLATEILCGLYEAPVIPQNVWKDDRVLNFDKFDKWNDKVHYSFDQPKRVNEYYPSEVAKESITEDNYLQLRAPYREGHTYSHTITLSTMETRKDYMDIAQWNKYHNAKPYHVSQLIDLARNKKFKDMSDAIVEKM